MWRSKKLIIVAVLMAVMLAGSIGGVVLAADNGDDSEPEAVFETLWDRVSGILQDKGVDITSEQLKDSFAQAQREIRNEALQNRLQNLVNEDQITQDEADQYLEWWQSKPDVSIGLGFGGRSGFRGMGGPRGFLGPCAPAE